eukprot:1848279-Prorocentrum_lima.AAC.1
MWSRRAPASAQHGKSVLYLQHASATRAGVGVPGTSPTCPGPLNTTLPCSGRALYRLAQTRKSILRHWAHCLPPEYNFRACSGWGTLSICSGPVSYTHLTLPTICSV